MIPMTASPALRLVMTAGRMNDADHCQRKATAHRDRCLAMTEMARTATNPSLQWDYALAAQKAEKLAAFWQARADALEGDRNG